LDQNGVPLRPFPWVLTHASVTDHVGAVLDDSSDDDTHKAGLSVRQTRNI